MSEPATCAFCREHPHCRCDGPGGDPVAWAPFHPEHGFSIGMARKNRHVVDRFLEAAGMVGWTSEALYGSGKAARTAE